MPLTPLVLFPQFEMPKATSKKSNMCPKRHCSERIKSSGHTACPAHSPCNQEGWYIPEHCVFCKAQLADLGGIPQADQQSSRAWARIDRVIRALRAAIHPTQLKVVMDQTLEKCFRDAIHGSQGASATGLQGAAPPPPAAGPVTVSVPRDLYSPRPTTPATPPRSRIDSDRFTRIESILQGLADRVQALSESPRPMAEGSRKRARTDSSSSSLSDASSTSRPAKVPRRQERAMPRTPSPTPHSSEDEVEEESFSEEDPGPSGSTAPPPASRGWQLCPSFWTYDTVDGVIIATNPYVGPDHQPNVENDIASYGQGKDAKYYFRPRGKVRDLPPSQRDMVARIPQSLASLSPWVMGGQGPSLSVSLAGAGRKADGCEVKDVSLTPALSLHTLPAVWASKVAGDKPSGPNRDESNNDPKPFRQIWPESSTEETTFTFLRESQGNECLVPGGLSTPSAASIKKDRQARAAAHRVLQAAANHNLLSISLRAAASSERVWSSDDVKTFLAAAATVSEGVGALFAPHARDLVRAAVSQRVALREEAIPKSLASVKQKLLSLDPLSPFLFGDSDAVSTIINSRPPPAEVEIKGLSQLQNLVKSSSHSKGQGQNRSSNHRSSGHKNQGGGGKSKDSRQGKSQGHSKSTTSKKPFHKPGGQGHNKRQDKPSNSSSSDDSKPAQKRN